MTLKVRFNDVSKRYQLGLTRTSLPTLLSNSLKWAAGHRKQGKINDKEFWALRQVGFELYEGESLALVGRNGSGKTTLLKLLANITKPTSGTIETYGKLSALIELGSGFHPDLTGRENIYLNGAILGLNRREIDRRFDEVLDFSELEQFIDTPIKRYSSGMTVRLGFAVASCIEPDILLVDEVLAVGDAAFQEKCLRRIRSLINQGTSIIFVSHNVYLVQAICTRALYLTQGHVTHLGSTKEVLDHYEQDLHRARTQRFESAQLAADSDEETDIEITRVEVYGAGGPNPAPLPNDRPAQIRVHYNAYQRLGQVQVSIFVIRSDGVTCCMMRTKLDNVELSVERGQGVVSVLLDPLQLVTGTYFAEAWFLNSSDSVAITPRGGRSDWFSVKGAALSNTDDSGVFEPNTRWSHQTSGHFSLNGSGHQDQLSNAQYMT